MKKRKYASAKAAKQARINQENWENLLKKYDVKKSKVSNNKPYVPPVSFHRSSYRDIPSLNSYVGSAVKSKGNIYSGDNMLGISTLHKSNAVPVFSKKDIESHSKMRR